jgi:hypothetical protein
VRNRPPTLDQAAINRHRAELLAILAALEAFLAQCRAADTKSPDTETS